MPDNDAYETLQPGFFLRSFFAVAGHYVVMFVSLLLLMLLIARVAYPDIYRLWTLPQETRQQFRDAWALQPEIFFPPGMCWSLIGLGFVLACAVGLSLAWWAPFAKVQHGVFLAVICIVTLLQVSLTQPQLPKWMMMGLLAVCPVGVVIGSRWGTRWMSEATHPADSLPSEDDG